MEFILSLLVVVTVLWFVGTRMQQATAKGYVSKAWSVRYRRQNPPDPCPGRRGSKRKA